MKSRRHERLENLIQKEISEVIQQEIDAFEGFFVTITNIDISPDYKNVKVFYSVLGDDETKKKFARKLDKVKSQIRFAMGNRINFRAVPTFSFKYDENVEKAAKIETILYDLKKHGDL